MIYKVSGKIIMKSGGKVSVELRSGLAFEISMAMSSYASLPSLGDDCEIYTHMVSREDGMFLYGFLSLEEKSLFLLLNTVSKIGPKMALTILGNVGRDELATAIVSSDVSRISKIPGIGKKTAERIIVELKDKLKAPDGIVDISPVSLGIYADVLSALCNLGYKNADCEKILSELPDEEDFQSLFKKALNKLNK